MKRLTVIVMISLAAIIASFPYVRAQVPMPPVLAQVPFWQWPALYSASENLVVKRGLNIDGTPNGKLYLRIGWDGCLAVYESEWQDMINTAQTDRYINLRDFAESRLNQGPEVWGADDDYNCPDEPATPVAITDYIFN